MMSRVSFAKRNSSYGDEEKDSYARMFNYIDVGNEYEITKAQFRLYLQSVGLTDEVGLDFACEAFQLMDLDGSGDMGECIIGAIDDNSRLISLWWAQPNFFVFLFCIRKMLMSSLHLYRSPSRCRKYVVNS